MDCLSMANKERGQEKKNNKAGKIRRACIAWEDHTSSSNSSQEEIEANLCLMVGEKNLR